VDAVYGFVRVPDEWVDNPNGRSKEETGSLLSDYRSQLVASYEGRRPALPVLRAFADVARASGIPLSEPLKFLEAMEQDLDNTTFATYPQLRDYMRGSAVAVGHMVCRVLGATDCAEVRAGASALAEAMQLTNFLRDIGEDLARGRVYLPLDELARHGVTVDDLRSARVNPRFVDLMKFQIERARTLYSLSDAHVGKLPPQARPAVRAARVLYSRILDKIEAQRYDVFRRRARASLPEKAWLVAWCMASGHRSAT
jgi:phytoene synthase